ncbi:hypothetical protein [Photobacterium sp. Hal280]|uniref:hypothetical protein n=1 Tax=Photobacterium sp. Hal280 TaxID=3035163 RepID=UPI00301CA9FB
MTLSSWKPLAGENAEGVSYLAIAAKTMGIGLLTVKLILAMRISFCRELTANFELLRSFNYEGFVACKVDNKRVDKRTVM